MNAHALAYMAETPLAVLRALSDAVAIYDNDDAVSREIAIEAIASGRAAFWSTARYHNATACMLLDRANRMPIDDAVSFITDPHKRARMADFLDTLVPLNAKAENALALAYAQHTSTWRDEDELAARRVRDTRSCVMAAPRAPEIRTPDSDVPPADWRDHPEGFEDGFFEDWDGEPDNGGYDEDEAWF